MRLFAAHDRNIGHRTSNIEATTPPAPRLRGSIFDVRRSMLDIVTAGQSAFVFIRGHSSRRMTISAVAAICDRRPLSR